MSKLYEVYKKLKNENEQTIYLFKSGIFYICLEEDAKFLSKKYDFKLTNLTPDILKCGFPCSSFDKYYMLFNNDHVDFKIVESNTVFDGSDYLQNKNIKNLLDKIDNININDLSVSESFRFIEDIKSIVSSLK